MLQAIDVVGKERRDWMDALAKPGTVVSIGAGMESLPGLDPAAIALLLALLDHDTRLWLSPGIAAGRIATSLKFHTGCSLAASPGEADFALVACVEELPSLESFSAGPVASPERSAIVVLQVPAILESGWRLTGPGIRNMARMSVPALGHGFFLQWERNRARFPRGIDLYVSSGERLCGLPHTTHIEH